MEKSLDQKLARLRKQPGADVFILADAKDADMAWGLASAGKHWPPREGQPWRSNPELIADARAIAHQGHVDILLASVSTMSVLAQEERIFDASPVTPAIRANDSTDIWLGRGATYAQSPSLPFSTCWLDEAQYGRIGNSGVRPTVNLGLYSLTFCNDAVRDRETLQAFRVFRRECAERRFRYFLEVFAPNVTCGLSAEELPAFVNDQIVRTLAGVSREHRPDFLKIPYFGPRWLEELVQYDPTLVVGVLGGASGTTHDAFKLLEEAKRHGARAALFGRKIKEAEHPLTFVSLLRRIADEGLAAEEAVKLYHSALAERHLPAKRTLEEDLALTMPELQYLR